MSSIITKKWLSVAMETRVLIRSDPKHNAALSHPNDSLDNLVAIRLLVAEIYMFEGVYTHKDGQTPACLLRCEPLASVTKNWDG